MKPVKKYLYPLLIALLLASIILYTIFSRIVTPPRLTSEQICGFRLSGLGKEILMYANDYDGYLPDCNQWCDLLILFADTALKELVCPNSYEIEGESSYAMNINLKGKKLNQVDPNTVVIFETIYGKNPNGRDVTVSTRYSYQILKEKGEDVSMFGENPEKRKVYKNCWNKAGGPEILTAENHKGKGANVLFADCSVRWIPKRDFNNLYWGKEANIE